MTSMARDDPHGIQGRYAEAESLSHLKTFSCRQRFDHSVYSGSIDFNQCAQSPCGSGSLKAKFNSWICWISMASFVNANGPEHQPKLMQVQSHLSPRIHSARSYDGTPHLNCWNSIVQVDCARTEAIEFPDLFMYSLQFNCFNSECKFVHSRGNCWWLALGPG